MKKIITLMLMGFISLFAQAISKDYDIVTKKNGSYFEMLWISGTDTVFGKYTIPEELSEKEATDIILGKVKSFKKEGEYFFKTYSLSASCDAILVKETVYGIDPTPFLEPLVLFLLLFSPFAILLVPFGFYWYKHQKKIYVRDMPAW